jgi:hypothetical protein
MNNNITKSASYNFHGDLLDTFIIDGRQYVGAKRVAEAIGVDWKGQHRNLLNDESYMNCHMTIHLPDALGRLQETICLDIKYLNGWLFKINPNKVKPAIKQKLVLYRQECFIALYDHFNKPQQKKKEEDTLDLSMRFNTQATLILNAMVEQRKKQQELEAKVTGVEAKIASIGDKANGVNDDGLITISSYAQLYHIRITKKKAQLLGYKVASIYRERFNKEPNFIPNPIYGRINTYSKEFLKEIFEKEK